MERGNFEGEDAAHCKEQGLPPMAAAMRPFRIVITFCHEHLHIAFFWFFSLLFSRLLYFFVFICVYVLYFLCYHELANKDLYIVSYLFAVN